MHSVLYFIATLVMLVGVVALLMKEMAVEQENATSGKLKEASTSSAEEREDYFSMLMSKITPDYFWRVSSEYIDFTYATIKRMRIDELTACPELFNAQRRCSDLNSAVYKYYDNIKKRCAEGEQVSLSDIEVLNLRQCFNELSHEAYPRLVALVWPQYQRPAVELADV